MTSSQKEKWFSIALAVITIVLTCITTFYAYKSFDISKNTQINQSIINAISSFDKTYENSISNLNKIEYVNEFKEPDSADIRESMVNACKNGEGIVYNKCNENEIVNIYAILNLKNDFHIYLNKSYYQEISYSFSKLKNDLNIFDNLVKNDQDYYKEKDNFNKNLDYFSGISKKIYEFCPYYISEKSIKKQGSQDEYIARNYDYTCLEKLSKNSLKDLADELDKFNENLRALNDNYNRLKNYFYKHLEQYD